MSKTKIPEDHEKLGRVPRFHMWHIAEAYGSGSLNRSGSTPASANRAARLGVQAKSWKNLPPNRAVAYNIRTCDPKRPSLSLTSSRRSWTKSISNRVRPGNRREELPDR